MFKELLKEEELYRPGIGFYSLWRTFETVAGETLDQPAVDLVISHTMVVCPNQSEKLICVVESSEWKFRTGTTIQGLVG